MSVWYHRRAHGSIAGIMVPHGTHIPVDQGSSRIAVGRQVIGKLVILHYEMWPSYLRWLLTFTIMCA